ncbi:N-6 DNA methylase [Methylobacterium goesingense]|uniref:tRNA1(Val) A37 N6-methylase TrmN6 n=1 Tax=Methylobacterium goesingense TaxID=243690 RepID=A0ABV2L6M3_9HYPH|nr:methyltransferase [Methylobacterium goesingense]GJD75131.1 Ribosomal RNA large subunit methyltransferase G [Methylobacterium goesingense]
MNDRHYTPAYIAEFVTNIISGEAPELVADFACGEGALLRAASIRWPHAKLIATDLDEAAVACLRGELRVHYAASLDFLNPPESYIDMQLSEFEGSISLILLNPPFSCKGRSSHQTSWNGINYRSSKALAFVLRSLIYLKPGGQVIALLPLSCLSSQKDAHVLESLSCQFEIEVIDQLQASAFKDCNVRVAVVRFTSRTVAAAGVASTEPPSMLTNLSPLFVTLVRGSYSNPPKKILTSGRYPLIHSTDLKRHSVTSARTVNSRRSTISSPAVLIPRVGRFRLDKICEYNLSTTSVLTDCVIAIIPASNSELIDLIGRMKDRYVDLDEAYSGTCAPYITLSRLQRFLARIAVCAVVPERSRDKIRLEVDTIAGRSSLEQKCAA